MGKEKSAESWQEYVLRFEWHATYFKLVDRVLPKVQIGIFHEYRPLDPVSFVAMSTRLAVGRKFFAKYNDSLLLDVVATHILKHADMDDGLREMLELIRKNANKVKARLEYGENSLDRVVLGYGEGQSGDKAKDYIDALPEKGGEAAIFGGLIQKGTSIKHYSALLMNGLVIHADPIKTRALVNADPVDISRTLINHWIDIDETFNLNGPDSFGPENAWEMVVWMLEIIRRLRAENGFNDALDDPWPIPWE